MRKYTLSEIKHFVRLGIAQDITNATHAEVLEISNKCDNVGYSCGKYNINGGLLQDRTSGTMYAVTARNSTLFMLF
ncbi:hypothetical protein [uncultured Eubacterium sp.]|uniref:hypothetical protein n=1 Tax=uncultured Eubacterium sp. TaxID=165185 RepID=UPI0025ECBA4E|nr:hypothetical protein [uncultured Eubacterium sp.]